MVSRSNGMIKTETMLTWSKKSHLSSQSATRFIHRHWDEYRLSVLHTKQSKLIKTSDKHWFKRLWRSVYQKSFQYNIQLKKPATSSHQASLTALIAALAFSVSKIVSIKNISTPPKYLINTKNVKDAKHNLLLLIREYDTHYYIYVK